MHLPQSPPLHRINGFAPFFHRFISVLPLHSRHTAKSQFFHCFSIVSRVLYTIMVPHRSLNFSIVFPCHQFPSFYFYFCGIILAPHHSRNFSIVFLLFDSMSLSESLDFSIAFPYFYSISFSPPFQFPLCLCHNFSSNSTLSSHNLCYQFILPFH